MGPSAAPLLPPAIEAFLAAERPRPLTRVIERHLVMCLPGHVSLAEHLRGSLLLRREAGAWCWYVCLEPPAGR